MLPKGDTRGWRVISFVLLELTRTGSKALELK